MTRFSVLERVALVAVALFLLTAGLQVGSGEGWWRWPVSIGLVLAGLAVGLGVAVVAGRQGDGRAGERDGERDGAGGDEGGDDGA